MAILKQEFGKRVDAIITDCYVVMPNGITDKDGNRRYCKIENAAWDTGATDTIISPSIVVELGLQPTGKTSISSYGGAVEVNTYTIDLCFQNGTKIENLEVLSGEYCDYDVLIGMDVITQGDFCVSTKNGKTSFYFRTPGEGVDLKWPKQNKS